MCQFLSAIVTRKGEILCNPLTDSHSDLISHFGLHEGSRAVVRDQNFIRVEFTPAAGEGDDAPPQYDRPEKYTLTVDETWEPEWFDDHMRGNVTAYLRQTIERMIVRDRRAILLGDAWIIADGAQIGKADNTRIVALMCGGTLTEMFGGTLTEMHGGTLTRMYGGTLMEMHGGTLARMYGGALTRMYGGTLTRMCGGTLTRMYGGTFTLMSGGTLTRMYGGTLAQMSGGTLAQMSGGTLTEITDQWGYDPKIPGDAVPLKDSRK